MSKGAKEDESSTGHILALDFTMLWLVSLGMHFETYEPSTSSIFIFFSGSGKLQISETMDTGAPLYTVHNLWLSHLKYTLFSKNFYYSFILSKMCLHKYFDNN
jgi:hypothetical protein